MAVAMGLGRFFYTPVLPAMMAGLGLGPSEAGWIASANYAGYLLGAILAAWGWAEGIERKVALSAGVATALLLLAMGLSSDFAGAGRHPLSGGLASAFVMIFTSAIVLSHGLASGRPWVQSGHFGGVGFGIHLGADVRPDLVLPMVAGAWPGSWRRAWPSRPGGGEPLPAARCDARGPAKKEPPLVWTRPLIALTLAYGIFGFGYIVTATFLVAIVRDGGGSSLFEAGVWLVTGLAAAPSVAYWMPAVRRIGLSMCSRLAAWSRHLGVAPACFCHCLPVR
jgi:hypothetical protein